MSQFYAASHLAILDERFTIDSKTDSVVNNGIRLDFAGRNTVTIYNNNTVAETNYVRSGTNRFGSLVEIGTGTETFVLSQDKAATWTVDRGNLEDSMMAQEVAKGVKRQVREVSVPTVDIYRLATAFAYAVANSQGTTAALSASNTYQSILTQQAALDDALVTDNRVCFVTPTTLNYLKRDPEFMKACDTSYADLKKGVFGNVDGLTITKVPTSYLPANAGFMIIVDDLLIAPTKFNSVRILTDVQGIDGSVPEMRRYYDCFIPTQKAVAIRYQKIA